MKNENKYSKSIVIFFTIFTVLINIKLGFVKDISIAYLVLALGAIVLSLTPIKHLITTLAYTIYFYFLGIFQLLLSIVSPDKFVGFNMNEAMIKDNTLRKYYIIYLIVFYLISIIIIWFNYITINIRNKYKFKKIAIKKRYFLINPYIILIAFSIIEYIFRKQFNILVPGKAPLLPNSGIFVYAIQAIGLYIKYLSCEYFYKEFGSSSKFMGNVIMTCLITGLPGIALGSRSTFIFDIIHFILFITFIFIKSKGKIRGIGKYKYLIFIFALITINLGNKIRFETKVNYLDFFLQRFTGLSDALASISYYIFNGQTLGLGNYLNNIIGESSINVTTYHTIYVMGFPPTGVHSNALPIFTAGLLYNGMLGLIIFSIMFSWILSSQELGIIKFLRNSINSREIMKIFITLYFYTRIFFSCIMEGRLEDIRGYILIYIILLVISSIFNVNLVSRKRLEKIRRSEGIES